jgi:uncharacterized protein with von Willebrand factor type A (vWA) domain
MANGYDPGAFDIIREEYEDRREAPERPERDRDLPERVREDDRDADAARLADDLLRELDKLPGDVAQDAVDDLRDMAVEMDDEFLELGLAKLTGTRPRNLRRQRERRGIRGPGRQTIRRSGQFRRDMILPRFSEPVKKKRKVSKYQKEFGKQLKKLKAKHVRTPITKLMKRAHTATRKAMK